MNLAAVTARYTAAKLATVERHSHEWSTFAHALRLLRTLRNDAAAQGATADLETLVTDLWSWAYTLTDTPVAPVDAGTRHLHELVRAHLDTGRDSGHSAVLTDIAAVLTQIDSEPHPAAATLEDVLSRYGPEHHDDPAAVYIAARQQHITLIEQWLKEQELDADVRTVTQLKTSPVRQAIVLLGPPSRFYVSAWCPLPAASRVGGWLLSTPAAPAVHLLTWPGHPGFDAADACLLPVSEPPKITVSEVRPRSRTSTAEPSIAPVAEPPELREPIWLPPLPVDTAIPVGAWTSDREPVTAAGFRLAGRSVVFFNTTAGPRPQLVTWDLGAVDIAASEPRSIKPGHALLFHPDRSATDDELGRRAGVLLTEKYGPGATEKALAAKRELKDALRRSTKPHDRLVYELTSKLNDDQYARHIINAIRYPEYIAPEKPGAYDALRQVLGLPKDVDSYRWLRALRGAQRRAGHEATNDLLDVLTSTTSWQPTLEATGIATVAGGEHVGCLELRIVIAVDPSPKKIGRSRLGRLLPDPSPVRQAAL